MPADKMTTEPTAPTVNAEVEKALYSLVSVARSAFGETEYAYYRVAHTWRGTRRNGSYYSSATNQGQRITKEEYEAHVQQGKQDAHGAFFGKRTEMYYDTWEREISKPGWRERLMALLKDWEHGHEQPIDNQT